MIMTELKAH